MRTVILADDSPDFNLLLQTFLTKDNPLIEVIPTFTGKETIDKYIEIKPDVLILDYQLQDMTGIDVLRELEKDETECAKKNVVFVTGENTINSELFSFNKVSNYFNKTFCFEKIRNEVCQIIREERKRKRHISKELNEFFTNQLGIKRYELEDYKYLTMAIELAFFNDELLDNLTPAFKIIGEKYSRKPSHVDNKIYYSVNSLRDIMPKSVLNNVYHYYTASDKYTVKTFIKDTLTYLNEIDEQKEENICNRKSTSA